MLRRRILEGKATCAFNIVSLASDRPLILDLFTTSDSGFRSWEGNDYVFTIPTWRLGKCPLRGRSHWSSPLLLPYLILNNLLFIYLVYTHNTHKYTHTQFSCTFFRFGAGAPGLGAAGVRLWELAPPGMGFLSSLACPLLPDSLQRADLAAVSEPFPAQDAWAPFILSVLPVVRICQDSLPSQLPTAQQE